MLKPCPWSPRISRGVRTRGAEARSPGVVEADSQLGDCRGSPSRRLPAGELAYFQEPWGQLQVRTKTPLSAFIMWMHSIHCWHGACVWYSTFYNSSSSIKISLCKLLCVRFRVPRSWSVLFYVCIDRMMAKNETWIVGWIVLILCSWLSYLCLGCLENCTFFIPKMRTQWIPLFFFLRK